jgi:hypothetical protein
VRRHPHAAIDLGGVDCTRSLGRRVRAHSVERPAEVDRGWPGRDERVICCVEVLPSLGRQRIAVRGGDADRRRAANRERADGVRDLRRRPAPQLDLLVRKSALVEEDDRLALQADDAVGC